MPHRAPPVDWRIAPAEMLVLGPETAVGLEPGGDPRPTHRTTPGPIPESIPAPELTWVPQAPPEPIRAAEALRRGAPTPGLSPDAGTPFGLCA